MRAVIEGSWPTRAERRFADVDPAQVTKHCATCDEPLAFASAYLRQSDFCSRECFVIWDEAWAAELARREQPQPCAVDDCDEVVIPGSYGRTTCSDRCRKRVNRSRLQSVVVA